MNPKTLKTFRETIPVNPGSDSTAVQRLHSADKAV